VPLCRAHVWALGVAAPATAFWPWVVRNAFNAATTPPSPATAQVEPPEHGLPVRGGEVGGVVTGGVAGVVLVLLPACVGVDLAVDVGVDVTGGRSSPVVSSFFEPPPSSTIRLPMMSARQPRTTRPQTARRREP